MKLAICTAIISSSVAHAFHPKLHVHSVRRASAFRMVESIVEAPTSDGIIESGPIKDPMGLYSVNSEERKSGKIKAVDFIIESGPIQDPMGLYSINSEERKSGEIKADDFIIDSGPIQDPMGLYSVNSEERKSGKIKADDFIIESGPIKDPMGLYSVNSEERKSGKIKSTEDDLTKPGNDIYDPLNIYPGTSEEKINGRIKLLEPELKVTKAVVDPLSMYSNDDAVDKGVVMSTALPFTTCPAHLTGELAGDFGFDPLGFTKNRSDLMTYREAEIKHARLAMLAAAGWPLSEVFDRKIAALLHLSPLLDKGERVPSLLNGGLEKVNPFYWMGCVAIAAAVEFYGVNKSRAGDESYFPGNLGFDPLGLYPKDEDGQRRMQLAEIKNGRLAMIAVLGFAIQEFVLKVGVVDETPYFFFPWGNTIN